MAKQMSRRIHQDTSNDLWFTLLTQLPTQAGRVYKLMISLSCIHSIKSSLSPQAVDAVGQATPQTGSGDNTIPGLSSGVDAFTFTNWNSSRVECIRAMNASEIFHLFYFPLSFSPALCSPFLLFSGTQPLGCGTHLTARSTPSLANCGFTQFLHIELPERKR